MHTFGKWQGFDHGLWEDRSRQQWPCDQRQHHWDRSVFGRRGNRGTRRWLWLWRLFLNICSCPNTSLCSRHHTLHLLWTARAPLLPLSLGTASHPPSNRTHMPHLHTSFTQSISTNTNTTHSLLTQHDTHITKIYKLFHKTFTKLYNLSLR